MTLLDGIRDPRDVRALAVAGQLGQDLQGVGRQTAEHLTGRAFVTQTWELRLDAFPAAEIELATSACTAGAVPRMSTTSTSSPSRSK